MPLFTTAISALQVSQRALEIIGHNIANANTPGYHRQEVYLASRLPTESLGFAIGTGVEINDIRRLRNSLLESSITRNTFELGNTTAQLETLRHVEALMTTGEGSIHDRLEAFFNQLEQLSARPDDISLRRITLQSATGLASEINTLDANLDRLNQQVDQQIQAVVAQVNQLAGQIAELNGQIQRSEVRGIKANDLRDQRDQLVEELAGQVGVQVHEQENGVVSLIVGGAPIVGGTQHFELEATFDAEGTAVVVPAGTETYLNVTGGRLSGLLRLRNQTIPEYQDRLETFAHEFISNVDAVHATGLPLTGPRSFVAGQRSVTDITLPLAQSSEAFAVQAGSVFVTVTDLATGQRTLSEIAFDPATQSLSDFAAALSAVPHLQGLANAQSGRLVITAEAGYAFDFAGRLERNPSTAAITGSTIPQIGGIYTGTDNDRYKFTVVGSGTVGVTPSLKLKVTNSAGVEIANLDIGQGYEPGQPLEVAEGMSVQLSSGTANDGDSFQVDTIAQPDSAGLLRALGLGSFFLGQGASDIRLNPELAQDPSLLAGSRSGEVGDGSNIQRMAALRDAPLLSGGTQTLREFYASLVSDNGAAVQHLTEQQQYLQVLGERLDAERQGISGVDPNEELVHLMQFQRAFQMAARYVATVNDTLDTLFSMI